MARGFRFACYLFLLSNTVGCALCANPFDEDFVTYGSRTPRSDMKHGRVGSPMSDPGYMATMSQGVEILDEEYGEILEDSTVPGDSVLEATPETYLEPLEANPTHSPLFDEPLQLGPTR